MSQTYHRCRSGLSLLFVCVLLLVSACAAPAPQAGAPASAPAAGGEKIFRATIPVFMQDWSPLRGGGWNMHYLAFWIAGTTYIDQNGDLQPYVFTEWSSNDDKTVWTFKIDPKAVYSDGSPITAEDVVATWNLIANPATTHQRVNLFLTGVVGFDDVFNGKGITMPGVVAVDAQTVEVTLVAADPIFHLKLATNLIGPVKASQAIGPDGFEVPEWWHPKNKPATSGPYMPESMDLDKGIITFVRNPNFWKGTPQLDKVVITSIEDTTVVTTMLANDELDQGWPGGPEVQALLGADWGKCIEPAPGMGAYWINPNIEPTNDINFRKALIMAVDREQIWQLADPTGSSYLPTGQLLAALPGEDPDFQPYPYDPEGAKQALAASKYANVADVPKMIMAGVRPGPSEVIAQYIAEQWRQILGIEQIEMSPQFDSYEGPGQPALFSDGIGTRVLDPVLMLMAGIHSSSNTARNIMGNYKDGEIDALIEEAAAKAVDDPERVQLAQAAQKKFHDSWLAIPTGAGCISNPPVMPWVKNAYRNADSQFVAPWNITIEK